MAVALVRRLLVAPALQAWQYSRPVLTLFTKEDCQLCEEALEQLSPHLHKVTLEVIDIEEEGREAEYDKFRYEIPVFFFNKKFLCKNRIDLDKFDAAVDLASQKTETD